MKYNLCIPIPIRSASIEEVKPIIDKAIRSKPNLIELRFDYISNLNTLSVEFIRNLLNIIHPHAPAIFTFRDSSEGGQIQIKQDERFRIYKKFIETKPDYIDIDMNTNENYLWEIINFTSQKGIKIIFSYHNFEKTLSYNEGKHLLYDFYNNLITQFSIKPNILKTNIYKIIFTAQTFGDNLIPLKICKNCSKSKVKIISFCMGTLGIFSRIMCVTKGSFMTYASLDEETAAGQINIHKMRDLYNLMLY